MCFMFMKLLLTISLTIIMIHASAQKFPPIEARSLSGEQYTFPARAEGKVTLIVVAFKRQSQPLIDQWVGLWEKHFGNDPAFGFYEIPMLASGWKIMRGIIDGGMQSGVPASKHDKTATYYGPLDKYYEALEIDDRSIPYFFLLDTNANIQWRESGRLTDAKAESLLKAAKKLT